MENNTYNLSECSRLLDFPLHIDTAARRKSNSYRHQNNRLTSIHLCFVLSEESDEILELDGVPRMDCNPPFMRVTYPGSRANHLVSSSRNELFFAYGSANLENFRQFGFHNCNFSLTERFSSLLTETEKLLPNFRAMGIADQLDRLAVMLGMEAMLSSLSTQENPANHETERIHQVKNFFQFHYTEDFDLDKILSRFGISRRTFYREWSRAFTESPAEFLLRLRMNEARLLLQNTYLRIYEVANECGYPSETYFCRCFTKEIGMTPQAYRKLYKKEPVQPTKYHGR